MKNTAGLSPIVFRIPDKFVSKLPGRFVTCPDATYSAVAASSFLKTFGFSSMLMQRSTEFGDFAGLTPWQAPADRNGHQGTVPPYPVASNQRNDRSATAGGGGPANSPARSELNGSDASALREQIRRLILEELSQLAGG